MLFVTIIYEQKPIKLSILTYREMPSDEINFYFSYICPFDANFSVLKTVYYFAATFTLILGSLRSFASSDFKD